jgi:hypothetical protein
MYTNINWSYSQYERTTFKHLCLYKVGMLRNKWLYIFKCDNILIDCLRTLCLMGSKVPLLGSTIVYLIIALIIQF